MIQSIYIHISIAKELLYDKYGFKFSHFQPEVESKEYESCRFSVNGLKIIHRTAKITPRKAGQFVTIWKRNLAGNTVPFEVSDAFDFIVISTRNEGHFGQFIFPKAILVAKGVISSLKEGKRGIRVYPPWEDAANEQAQKTQRWQLDYFLDIPMTGETVDAKRAVQLFSSY
jgi:hypothetical protein